MKHYSFNQLFLSVLLLAIFGTLDISAQQRPSGLPVPKIMQLKDLGQRRDETDTYLDKVFWGLRDATHEETQELANQLTARMKWADKMIEEMDNGTRPMDKAWYDELIQEGKCWLTFYIKIGESFSQQFCFFFAVHLLSPYELCSFYGTLPKPTSYLAAQRGTQFCPLGEKI